MINSIIKIIWTDTCHYPDQTGIASVIMEKAKTRTVEDIGWLIGEDDDRYVIATAKKEGGRWNKITAIPKGMVKEVISLQESK